MKLGNEFLQLTSICVAKIFAPLRKWLYRVYGKEQIAPDKEIVTVGNELSFEEIEFQNVSELLDSILKN